MRFEMLFTEDALNYLTKPKEQQRTTLRLHPSYQARTKHNGVGVAPFDFTGFGQEDPGHQDKHAARSFLFSWERERKGREGRVIRPATKREGIFWL